MANWTVYLGPPAHTHTHIIDHMIVHKWEGERGRDGQTGGRGERKLREHHTAPYPGVLDVIFQCFHVLEQSDEQWTSHMICTCKPCDVCVKNIKLDLPGSQTAGGDEGIDQTALTRYSAEAKKKYIILSLQTRSQALPASNVRVWIMGESETCSSTVVTMATGVMIPCSLRINTKGTQSCAQIFRGVRTR